MTTRVAVAVEETLKRTFASAIDWPGWSRSGRTGPAALEVLLAYADRYAIVAQRGRRGIPDRGPRVRCRRDRAGGRRDRVRRAQPGQRIGSTPGHSRGCGSDRPVGRGGLGPLRRGCRRGARGAPQGAARRGRDRSNVVAHVVEADGYYAKEIGVRLRPPQPSDRAAVGAFRAAMLDVLRLPSDGSPLADRRWTARYAAHRIAWHALDHAWEIEDRSETVPPEDRA